MKNIHIMVSNTPARSGVWGIAEEEVSGLVCQHPDDKPWWALSNDFDIYRKVWPVREHKGDHEGCVLIGMAFECKEPEILTIRRVCNKCGAEEDCEIDLAIHTEEEKESLRKITTLKSMSGIRSCSCGYYVFKKGNLLKGKA